MLAPSAGSRERPRRPGVKPPVLFPAASPRRMSSPRETASRLHLRSRRLVQSFGGFDRCLGFETEPRRALRAPNESPRGDRSEALFAHSFALHNGPFDDETNCHGTTRSGFSGRALCCARASRKRRHCILAGLGSGRGLRKRGPSHTYALPSKHSLCPRKPWGRGAECPRANPWIPGTCPSSTVARLNERSFSACAPCNRCVGAPASAQGKRVRSRLACQMSVRPAMPNSQFGSSATSLEYHVTRKRPSAASGATPA